MFNNRIHTLYLKYKYIKVYYYIIYTYNTYNILIY